MSIEKTLRLVAGFFILMSVSLAVLHNINWLWFTGFVGLNLFQSGLTNWCPLVTILKKAGIKSCEQVNTIQ